MRPPLIHILLANRQPLIRNGLRFLLEREPEFRVVAEAANGREAIVLADYKRPDMALLDIELPLVNGIDVARQIASKGSSPKLIFVTTRSDQGYVTEAFKAGARGFVAEDCAPADLPRAIRTVSAGKLFISPAILKQLLDTYAGEGTVSDYERELWPFLSLFPAAVD